MEWNPNSRWLGNSEFIEVRDPELSNLKRVIVVKIENIIPKLLRNVIWVEFECFLIVALFTYVELHNILLHIFCFCSKADIQVHALLISFLH